MQDAALPIRNHPATATALALLLVFLGGCGEAPGTPEAEIRELVRRTAEAAAGGELATVADALHADYRDARGNDREAMIKLLRLYRLRADKLLVLPDIESIEVNGADSARLDLTLRLAGADTGRLALEGGVYRMELDLVREDAWQVLSARWARADRPLR